MEVTMKKIAISLVLAASYGLAACGSASTAVEEDPGDARIAVDTAEAKKTAAIIEGRLKTQLDLAGTDIASLKQVYEDAMSAGVDSIATAVDKKLEAEILPKAQAAKRSSEVLALKKQVSIGSPIFKKLDVLDMKLLDAEMKMKQ